MPACLTPDAYDDWLGDHLGPEELVWLLDRSPSAVAPDLAYYPVSREVNTIRNEGPRLIEPQGGYDYQAAASSPSAVATCGFVTCPACTLRPLASAASSAMARSHPLSASAST